MELFLISQKQNNQLDAYDSAVVSAQDAETAKQIDPATGKIITDWRKIRHEWCDSPEHVTVRHLGAANADVEMGVLCSSYTAG